MARTFPPARPPARRPAKRMPAEIAGPAHEARVSSEVASAVAAVDAWFMADAGPLELDLTDSSMAAVEAAEHRVSVLGGVSTRSIVGGRVLVRAPSVHVPAARPADSFSIDDNG